MILVTFVAALALGGNAANDPPSAQDIASAYRSLKQITDHPVYVSTEIAMRCTLMITQAEIDAEKAKHGPHGFSAVNIYMNELAAQAFAAGDKAYPVGAVVVKEKSRLHKGISGVGGMVKRAPGYDTEHGDWEYFYFDDEAKVESGRIESCVQCHVGAKDQDHVFGTWNRAIRKTVHGR